MAATLAEKSCTPCRGGIPPLSREAAEEYHRQAPEWGLLDEATRIERTYRFKNFAEAFSFVECAAAVAEAKKSPRNWKLAISVVDPNGDLVYFYKMDQTQIASVGISQGKARTAALTKQPTRLWEERVKERPAFINYPAGLAIWGGVPIIYQNECVGAIGVSGVQSQDDEKVASAGVAALE